MADYRIEVEVVGWINGVTISLGRASVVTQATQDGCKDGGVP